VARFGTTPNGHIFDLVLYGGRVHELTKRQVELAEAFARRCDSILTRCRQGIMMFQEGGAVQKYGHVRSMNGY
jgi:hypothetical protein